MTALTIIQNACGRMGLQQPSAIFSSIDPQVIQLRSLLTQENKELAKGQNGKRWTALVKEKTFTSVALETQTSAVPADFNYYINDSMFDRTEVRKLIGPLNEYEWQREKAGPVYSSVYHAFRFRGGDILITPTMTAGNTIAYEYVTKYLVEDSSSAAKENFTADDDTAILEEEILTLGLIWRFRKAKGLDYSEEFRSYQMYRDSASGQDGGAPVLNLSRGLIKRRFYPANIKDGSWP